MSGVVIKLALIKVLNRGDIVFVDDGLISLKVTDKNDTDLVTGK